MVTEPRDDGSDEMGLDAFFAAGRAVPADMDGLMARIMADARAQAAPVALPPVRRRRRGVVAAVLAIVGGWPAVAGMVSAAAAGVWVGMASPDLVDVYMPGTGEFTVSDIMPDYLAVASGTDQ